AMGQGKEMARLFVRDGALTILADINENGKQTAEQIASTEGGVTDFIKVDVSSSREWKNAVEYIGEKYHRLDILVNNAGTPGRSRISALSENEWGRIMDVNAKSVFLGMKHTL